jgi:hypothetical protein
MPLGRPAASGDGEDEFDVAPVDLLMTGNADCPAQPARAQGLLGAHAVPGVGEDPPEANAGGDQAIEFGERNLRLGSRRAIFGGTRRRARAELRRRSRPPEGTVVSPPSPAGSSP